MKGHAQASIQERVRSFGELRQEIQGRLPKGPFEFVDSLSFPPPEPTGVPAVDRFNMAVVRDAAYATAGGPYLRLFGMSQSLRNLYDGGRQLVDEGGT
jgi:hypothetical protein